MTSWVVNDTIRGSKAITPSNTTDVDQKYAEALICSGAGDIAIEFHDESAGTIPFAADEIIKVAVKKVLTTGTTATGIRGLKLSL